MPWFHVIWSPNEKNAQIVVKTGFKFKKRPDEVAPTFFTPKVQSIMQTTVEITPVYKIDWINEPFIFNTIKCDILNGSRTINPNIPEYNVDIMGDVCFIAHWLQTENIPHIQTAVSIHKSPILKRKLNNWFKFPFERTKSTPNSENPIDSDCSNGNRNGI